MSAPTESLFDLDADALHRRIMAAVYATAVNRFEVEFEWPECHAKRCQARHGDPRQAMGIIQHQIAENVKLELDYYRTTRPDVGVDGDTPAEDAALKLGVILAQYNVHDAGTFIKAARLIVEAYPAIIPALTEESS